MMAILGAVFVVVGFVVLIHVLKLVDMSLDVIAVSKSSMALMRDAAMDEDAKEKAVQRSAIRLFGLAFKLTAGGAAAVLLPAAVIWLLDKVGVVSWPQTMATLLSWEFILISSLFAIAVLVFTRKRTTSRKRTT